MLRPSAERVIIKIRTGDRNLYRDVNLDTAVEVQYSAINSRRPQQVSHPYFSLQNYGLRNPEGMGDLAHNSYLPASHSCLALFAECSRFGLPSDSHGLS